jgi:hypothetical protein
MSHADGEQEIVDQRSSFQVSDEGGFVDEAGDGLPEEKAAIEG